VASTHEEQFYKTPGPQPNPSRFWPDLGSTPPTNQLCRPTKAPIAHLSAPPARPARARSTFYPTGNQLRTTTTKGSTNCTHFPLQGTHPPQFHSTNRSDTEQARPPRPPPALTCNRTPRQTAQPTAQFENTSDPPRKTNQPPRTGPCGRPRPGQLTSSRGSYFLYSFFSPVSGTYRKKPPRTTLAITTKERRSPCISTPIAYLHSDQPSRHRTHKQNPHLPTSDTNGN